MYTEKARGEWGGPPAIHNYLSMKTNSCVFGRVHHVQFGQIRRQTDSPNRQVCCLLVPKSCKRERLHIITTYIPPTQMLLSLWITSWKFSDVFVFFFLIQTNKNSELNLIMWGKFQEQPIKFPKLHLCQQMGTLQAAIVQTINILFFYDFITIIQLRIDFSVSMSHLLAWMSSSLASDQEQWFCISWTLGPCDLVSCSGNTAPRISSSQTWIQIVNFKLLITFAAPT